MAHEDQVRSNAERDLVGCFDTTAEPRRARPSFGTLRGGRCGTNQGLVGRRPDHAHHRRRLVPATSHGCSPRRSRARIVQALRVRAHPKEGFMTLTMPYSSSRRPSTTSKTRRTLGAAARERRSSRRDERRDLLRAGFARPIIGACSSDRRRFNLANSGAFCVSWVLPHYGGRLRRRDTRPLAPSARIALPESISLRRATRHAALCSVQISESYAPSTASTIDSTASKGARRTPSTWSRSAMNPGEL